jgi:hypothetical protein
MDIQHSNPLAKHFRKPAIYVKLPSGGKFWPRDSINLPENGEIPVYPMTTSDEITLKTPDALMNGTSVVSVVQSCCPNIKDAWRMPAVDTDYLLIAIRIASYGQNMEINTVCPHCTEQNEHEVALSDILDRVRCPDFGPPVHHDGLKIKLRPQDYVQVTQSNMISFEEEKLAQALAATGVDEEVRNARLKSSMKRIIDLNDQLMVKCTEYIEMSDGERVTDENYLREFYQNADARVVRAVTDRLAELAREAALPLSEVSCSECHKGYKVPIEFDYASFFAPGS